MRILLIVLGLVLSVAVGEIGIRLTARVLARTPAAQVIYDAIRLPIPFGQRPTLDLIASGQTLFLFDPDLGWTLNPGAVRTNDFTVHVNSQGMRAEREYSQRPAPGAHRYAAYGDSFTYCQDVSDQDCWTQLLENQAPSTEVLNFGVPSSAPDQAWLRYQRDGLELAPCAVLIGHMVENINRVVNRYRPFLQTVGWPLSKPRFILQGGELVLLPNPARTIDDLKDPLWVETNLGPHDFWYFPGTYVPNPLDRLQLVRLVRTARYQSAPAAYQFDPVDRRAAESWDRRWAERVYQPGTEPFEVSTRILTEFSKQVRANGSTPVVIIFPTSVEITSYRDGDPKPHSPLLQALEHEGVATIDLTDSLGQQARETPVQKLIATHLTPLGNAIVAQTLANRLPDLTTNSCGSN